MATVCPSHDSDIGLCVRPVPVADVDWQKTVDLVWAGMTIQQAAAALDVPYGELLWHLAEMPEMKVLLVDVAMVAAYKNRVLKGK